MVVTGTLLLGIRITTRKAVVIAVCYALFGVIVRQVYLLLDLQLGTHTVFLVTFLVIMLNRLGGVRLGLATAASLMSLLFLLLGDVATVLISTNLMQLDLAEASREPAYFNLFNLLNKSPMILGCIVGFARRSRVSGRG